MAAEEEENVAIFATRWVAVELPDDDQRLVVVTADRLVRISSPIAAWASETRIATTVGGQTYELKIEFYGWNTTSHSNFGIWLDHHSLSWGNVVEVSAAFGGPPLAAWARPAFEGD